MALAVIAGCAQPAGPSATPEELRPVTLLLGFRPDVQFAPFYLAQREGFYADAGLDVTIEHRQAPDIQRLVAAGDAEFGVADATDVMIARTSDIPIRYVSTLYESFPVALIGVADGAPSEPSDLAGRRIGTPGRFGSSWHALMALLDAGDLTVDDIEIREYPEFNQVAGLLNGDVDLITGFRNNEPVQLAARGEEVSLLTVDEVAPLPGPGVIVGETLLAADSDLVRAFAEATAQAQEAVIDDPDRGFEAARASVSTIDEDPDTARSVLDATVELWAGERLLEAGFGEGDVERILELVPLATHNQRGRGTLYVGTDLGVNAEQLVTVVESSMSAPVYELLKRPDELFVVEHAHLQPRFVEDSVRLALNGVLNAYPALPDDAFLFSRQVNLETIHRHDVLAERYGTVGELRAELERGESLTRHTDLRRWITS
jgi:NitT/TauT family transport system substrate-binding protein